MTTEQARAVAEGIMSTYWPGPKHHWPSGLCLSIEQSLRLAGVVNADLLAALEALEFHMSEPEMVSNWDDRRRADVEQARVAIARARGQQP